MDETDEALADHPVDVPHIDAALMLSFGAVIVGREAMAVAQFTELSRYLGGLLAEGVIERFRPFFFADGPSGDLSGFFLLDGRRDSLDGLRRDAAFARQVLRASAATTNVRVQTLVAGSEAGRLVNLYREVREDLGIISAEQS